ncbi:MAG: hypothetical protein HYT31_02495 [Parcubacteria group bacterium]|nr:hypothetical protein [Parcubacteria group bacterium]
MTDTDKKEILVAISELSKKTDESIGRLAEKTDASIARLAEKTDALAEKTDASIARLAEKTDALAEKTDASIARLTEKTDALAEKTDAILEAIGHFSDKTEARFLGVEKRLDHIESAMVTKDYLDEKLSDLNGDLTVLIRKEDHKLAHLVNILETRKVISPQDANAIFAMEPFPQMRQHNAL